ncbi:MAG: sensor histidine kinase [Acetivibrionales bacterium]|jgi:two-component system sensor histidine kinase YesM
MKRFTIQRRIFLYIVLLVSLLLSIIIVANYTVILGFLKKNEVDSAISAAQKTKQNIEIILKLANDLSASLGEEKEIQIELNRKNITYEYRIEQINKLLEQFISLQEYFDAVSIIGSDNKFFSSNPVFDLKKVLSRCQLPEDYYDKMGELFSYSNRYGYYVMVTDESAISYISPILDNYTSEYIGIVIVDINYTYLREAFTAASFEYTEKVMVADRHGKILFSSPRHVYLGEVIEKHPELLNELSIQLNSKVFGKGSIIVSDTIDYSGWKLIRIINTDKIYRSVNMLGQITLYIFIFSILFSLIASLLLSVSFTKPIVELNQKIKRVEKGDLSVAINTERKDELGELSASFNKMVAQIKNLINYKVEQQKKKSDMEFQILQAQINPHFLYNTLNTIKWLAVIQDVDNIGEMASAIINLLKYNISSPNKLVTLSEEIESIKNYVSIQKYRYGNNFSVEYIIDEKTVNLKMLKFILQPLVENSIFHGFKNYKYGGKIIIRSRVEDKFLIIEVIDNGCGIEKENGEHIELKIDKMHNGIGLANVHERIKLYFGAEYGITINSEKGVGTCVLIRLPVIDDKIHLKT